MLTKIIYFFKITIQRFVQHLNFNLNHMNIINWNRAYIHTLFLYSINTFILILFLHFSFIFTSFFPKLLYENGLVKIKGQTNFLFMKLFQASNTFTQHLFRCVNKVFDNRGRYNNIYVFVWADANVVLYYEFVDSIFQWEITGLGCERQIASVFIPQWRKYKILLPMNWERCFSSN